MTHLVLIVASHIIQVFDLDFNIILIQKPKLKQMVLRFWVS